MSVFLLPGLGGSGEGHWQAHWREAIPDAHFIEQQNWERPDLGAWIETTVAAIADHPRSTLVGHSLGAILIAQIAVRFPDLPIAGALLVAPADVEQTDRNSQILKSFGPMPTGPFSFPSIVVASRNDPYMRFDRARVLASMWEAKFIDLGNAGHINVASGYGAWPEGRLLVDRVSGRRTRPFLISNRPAEAPSISKSVLPNRSNVSQ